MKEKSVNKYYLSEFSYDGGEYEIAFNIIDLDFVNETNRSYNKSWKDNQDTFQLLRDNSGKLYFEFGRFYENKIALDNFVNVGA